MCHSKNGRSVFSLPENNFGRSVGELPEGLRRNSMAGLPQVSEPDVVRHYTNLSQMNFGVDTGFYPLGSCTMKYNPKINEQVASLPGFSSLHPLQPESTIQGVYIESVCRCSGRTDWSYGDEAVSQAARG